MFEAAELGHKLSKGQYKRVEPNAAALRGTRGDALQALEITA